MKNFRVFLLLCLALAVVAGVTFITGCTVAKGRDLAPRMEIFNMLNASGITFNRTLISTVYGKSKNQVILTGSMVLREPDPNSELVKGFKVTQYFKIAVENVDGKWKIIAKDKEKS